MNNLIQNSNDPRKNQKTKNTLIYIGLFLFLFLCIGIYWYTLRNSQTVEPQSVDPTKDLSINLAIPAPQYSLPSGNYAGNQLLSIADELEGVTIYYTTDNQEPKLTSAVYQEPIELTRSCVVRSIAVDANGNRSLMNEAVYIIDGTSLSQSQISADLPAPGFSIGSGEYGSVQQVEIFSMNPDLKIYYTTNGVEPTENSILYQTPIQVNETMILRAIAVDEQGNRSVVNEAYYIITKP